MAEDHGQDQGPRRLGVDQREDGEGGGGGQDRAGEDDRAAADPVGERGGAGQHDQGDRGGDGERGEHLRAGVADAGGVRDQVTGQQGLGGEGADADAAGQQHRARAAQDVEDGEPRLGAVLLHLGEQRALDHLETDEQADAEQQHAQQERHAPAPGRELVLGEGGDQGDHGGGDQGAERGPHLREARPEPTALLARVLHDHQGRATPLTADGDALDHAQGDQQDRCPDADGVVGGQQADEEAGAAHQAHGEQQHVLAAQAVAEVSEDDAADGAGHISGGEGAERGDRAHGGVGAGEEQFAEDERGDGAVDEEVVELDGGAEQSGEGDSAELAGAF